MLEMKNVFAGYGKQTVLWDFSVKVDEGEFVAILGSNGAGKTTALLCIMGLLDITGGEITYLNEKINGLRCNEIAKKGIGFITENGQLFLEMTVQENLAMGGYTIRSKKKLAENLEYVLDLFPKLKERRKQLAGTLSGGERRMLAIAKGLMLNPKILIIDEPSMGLAPNIVANVFSVIKKLNQEGMTILLSEQNANTTLQIAKRVYVVEHGRIILSDSSQSLRQNDQIKKAYLGLD